MYSKSSTFWALSSILAILAVLSIAINNMENSSVRRPFASVGKDSAGLDGKIALPKGWDSLTNQSSQLKPIIDTTESVVVDNKIVADETSVNFDNSSFTDQTVSSGTPQTSVSTDLLVKNINDELLRKVGFTNFVLKPKPFTGKLFGEFDISMLGPLNIVEKDVVESRSGGDFNVLTAYEFELGSKDTAKEIYDYLKAKITDELGVTINQTNQFGMASFYINFGVPSENAFLVVKMRSNVYALSYPKVKSGDQDYFGYISALLKELI